MWKPWKKRDEEEPEKDLATRPDLRPDRPNPGMPETYGMGWPFERKKKSKAR